MLSATRGGAECVLYSCLTLSVEARVKAYEAFMVRALK